jgi:hypothetical protein
MNVILALSANFAPGKQQAASSKQQAASSKQQAASSKQQAASNYGPVPVFVNPPAAQIRLFFRFFPKTPGITAHPPWLLGH